MHIITQTQETHDTFITISVSIDPEHYANRLFFVVNIDKVTNEASVFHQGRAIRTTHNLGESADAEDFGAFAVLACLSLAFNIKEQ